MIWCGFAKQIEVKDPEDAVRKALAGTEWYREVPDLRRVDAEGLLFERSVEELIVPHSFLPVFRLEVQSVDVFTKICIKVTPRRSVQIVMAIYTAIGVLFQLGLMGSWLRGEFDFSLVLLLPVVMIIFAQLLDHFMLRLSARHFLKAIRALFAS